MRQVNPSISYAEAKDWGLTYWARPLLAIAQFHSDLSKLEKSRRSASMSNTIKLGTTIYLKNKKEQYLALLKRSDIRDKNWPKLGEASEKVVLQILSLMGNQDVLKYGDTVKIKTFEIAVGDRDTLGAFSDSHDCYYWNDNYDPDKQGWTIAKVNGKEGDPIGYGDEIYLTNVAYRNQRLVADDRYEGYITTQEGGSDIWVLEEGPRRDFEQDEWQEYYEKFPEFSPEIVRKDCHPRIMEHPGIAEDAIVLVHGLTDSPYFMTAIADYFHNELNYNVYLPLLQGHGLIIPSGMEGVSLEVWKANVDFALDAAVEKAKQISIGGLSTGGALSCYMAARTNSKINGALYLFSAALKIAGSLGSGDLKESLLRTFMADVLDSSSALIGDNPYRYARMDKDGARELSKQIKEIDRILVSLGPKNPFPIPIFAAHSESDQTADIVGIEALLIASNLDRSRFFRIRKEDAVGHADLVLKEPVRNTSAKVLEKPNPGFDEMMSAIAHFNDTFLNKGDRFGKFQLQALKERIKGQEDANDILQFHQTVLENPEQLVRYAAIAEATYDIESAPQKLKALNCEVIGSSIQSDTWFLDGLQAMCVAYPQGTTQEMIVAYRGTEKTNPADLITDGGVISVLTSLSSDNIIRTLIYREMVEKTWANAAVAAAAKGTLAGQIGGRLVNSMKYYQQQAEQLDFKQYSKITIVGHSLGGLIAACVAYWARETYGQNIYAHTFNAAPGAKYALVEGKDQCDRHIANRIINHRILEDIVSGPPLPIGTDHEGFPYAHLGYIYNWRSLDPQSTSRLAAHALERFIKDLKCETEHLIGMGPAPVGTYYW